MHPVVSALASIRRHFVGGFREAKHGSLRAMTKSEIEALPVSAVRPSFEPDRVMRRNGKIVRQQGNQIPIKYCTFGPYRRALPAPHIGAKERAKTAHLPDGPMHRSPVEVRSNAFKRAQMDATKPKATRKPRAQKLA